MSDRGLHCLPRTLLGVSSLKRVKVLIEFNRKGLASEEISLLYLLSSVRYLYTSSLQKRPTEDIYHLLCFNSLLQNFDFVSTLSNKYVLYYTSATQNRKRHYVIGDECRLRSAYAYTKSDESTLVANMMHWLKCFF